MYRLQCYTEKAREARHRLERQYNARANRKKQCRPNETKPYSNATHHTSHTPYSNVTQLASKLFTITFTFTPAQKITYSYKWSHPKPHQVNAHTVGGDGVQVAVLFMRCLIGGVLLLLHVLITRRKQQSFCMCHVLCRSWGCHASVAISVLHQR